MGRNYRTSSAAPLDYMYQINTPLMERALMANDANITENLDLTQKLGELSHYNYLQGDEADATAITNGYMKQIEDVADTIRKDPANWRKQLEPIRAIKDKLRQDYTSGAISKHVANYNKRATDFAAIDKQVELYHTSGGTKGLDPSEAAAAKQHIDSQFDKTGYDAATGKYNIYKGGSVMDTIDVRKRLDDIAKEVKADENTSVKEDLIAGGAYFNKVTNKWEGITPEKLLQVVASAAQSDSQLQRYLAQRKGMGIIQGDINPYNAFNVGPIPIAKEEQANIDSFQAKMDAVKDPATKAKMKEQLEAYKKQLGGRNRVNYNPDSYLAPIMRNVVATRAYEKSSSENNMSNNSLYNTKLNISAANARDVANRSSRERIAGATLTQRNEHFKETQKNINDRFDKTLAAKEAATAAKGGAKGTGTGLKTTSTKEPIPIESTIEPVATNSFEGIMVKDVNTNQNVKLFSNAGLSSEINRKKAQLSTANEELKTIESKLSKTPDGVLKNQLQVKKESLQKQIKITESDLNDRRLWYTKSAQAAKSELKPDELAIYNQYNNDNAIKQLRKEVETIRAKHPNIVYSGEKLGVGGTNLPSFSQRIEESPEVKAANAKLQKAIEIKKKVDDGRESFLEGIRKTYIDEDGIKVGSKDSEGLQDLILNSSRGAQLFDNAGESTSGIQITSDKPGVFDFLFNISTASAAQRAKDGAYNLSFADNSLQDYIAKSGTEMIIQRVAPTTAIGNGNAVVEVQFKDPQGNIPANKSYFINATPAMQKALATKFKASKNADIANIAANLDDDLANSIRKQIARPKTQGTDNQFILTIEDLGRQPQQLYVTKSDDGHLFVDTGEVDEKGKSIGLPSLSGIEGSFNGPTELIQSIKKLRTLTASQMQQAIATGSLLKL